MPESIDLNDAVNRWNDLLERTLLLWEETHKLRQEGDGATEVRGGSFTTLRKVTAYLRVLEAGLRKAMDDIKMYRHIDERRGLTGEAWFKRMDELLGPEGGTRP
jgi:hypothetical protein